MLSRPASAAGLVASLVFVAMLGCQSDGPDPDLESGDCLTDLGGDLFELGGAELVSECVWFEGTNLAGVTGAHFVLGEDITFDLRFERDIPMDQDLDLAQASEDDPFYFISLVHHQGGVAGPEDLCTIPATGTLTIEDFNMNSDDVLDAISGSIDAQFDSCSVTSLGLSDEPVTFIGSF